MVSTNILQRTFKIKHKQKEGTCFTIDLDGKQYLITAKHILVGMDKPDFISIFHENKWKRVNTNIVGIADADIDIAVLALPFQLSPAHHLPANSSGIFLSQDIYFVGFPLGLQIDVGFDINRNFPLPLVKKGIISGFVFKEESRLECILLDGHNNRGFSGAPVVYISTGTKELNVAGVVSGFLPEKDQIKLEEQKKSLEIQYNSGIIIAYPISYAVDLIKNNPIGFSLK